MGIEQRGKIALSPEITGRRGRLVLLGLHVAGPVLRYGLENIMNGTNIDYEPGFMNEYVQGIKDGYLPILVGNHQSHVDGIFISQPVRILTGVANEKLPEHQKINGVVLVLASSLSTGHQGAMMKGFFDELTPSIERRNLTPLLHTRRQDGQRYNMSTNWVNQYKDLIDAINAGYAIAVFPEGTTTAGKTTHSIILPDGTVKTIKNPDGKRNGMQKFMDGSVKMLISAANKAGKKAMIIPVVMTGGPSVHNPDTKLPTAKAFEAGLNFGNNELVHIRVLNPLKADEGELEKCYRERDWEGLNTVVANKIAQHLSKLEQGVYAT